MTQSPSSTPSLPWMPIYTGDYARHTRELTQSQHGAYLLLTMHYWDTQSPLPYSKQQCYRIALAHRKNEKQNVDMILEKFFCLKDNVYHHIALNQLIEKTRLKLERLRQNGSIGGASSAVKKTGDAVADAEVEPAGENTSSQNFSNSKYTPQYFKIITSHHQQCESAWLVQCLGQYLEMPTENRTLAVFTQQYPSTQKIIDRWLEYPLPMRMAAYCYVLRHTHARNELIYALQLLRHNGYGKSEFNQYLELFEKSVREDQDYEVNFNG